MCVTSLTAFLCGVHVDVVVHVVDHLGEFPRQCEALGLDHALSAGHEQRLVLPGRLPAVERLLHAADQRTLWRLHRVLPGLVYVQDRAARLEHAEVIALHGQQGAVHDVVSGIVVHEHARAHDLRPVRAQRADDAPDGHIGSSSRPGAGSRARRHPILALQFEVTAGCLAATMIAIFAYRANMIVSALQQMRHSWLCEVVDHCRPLCEE